MEILIKILQFLLSFSLLVFIHEFGHFITAKMFGMRVERFYLFFNPWFSLWKKEYKGTTYGIGWVPFGGYVKIAGMVDESMDKEQMSQPPQPWEFRSKKPWKRLIVMAAGVMLNVLLSICVYIGISYNYGHNYVANDDVQYGYTFSQLGQDIGFRNGDKVLSVDGKAIDDYRDIFSMILIDQAREVEIERKGERKTIHIDEKYTPLILKDKERLILPRAAFVVAQVVEGSPAQQAGIMAGDTLVALNRAHLQFYDQWVPSLERLSGVPAEVIVSRNVEGIAQSDTLTVTVSGEGKIGVLPVNPEYLQPITTYNYSFFQAIPAGIKMTGNVISNYWKQLKLIFSPKTEAYKSLGGVIAIGSLFRGQWDWLSFWNTTAFLSLMLAVLNILPIPGLDGGHIVFCLYEMITGRKPNEKFMEWATTIGLLLLFAVIIMANGNDILKLFRK